jgi:hypothetical protein
MDDILWGSRPFFIMPNPKVVLAANTFNSTYALGNTKMYLVDPETGEVKLISDTYDWDYHNALINGKPQGRRDKLVFWERRRSAVDERHGFKLRFYGTGYILHK